MLECVQQANHSRKEVSEREVYEMETIATDTKKGLWRQRIGYGSSDFACNLIW